MRKPDVAIVLSLLSLFGVIGWTLLGGPGARDGTPSLERPSPKEPSLPDVRLAARADEVDPPPPRLGGGEAAQRPLLEARARANEMAALATLRNGTSAQAQAQASARIDVDRDGVGEFGGFLELSGAVEGRMQRRLVPPVFSRAFATLNAHGEVERNGYLYRVYLPDARGAGIGEPPTGFDAASGVDPDRAETTWCLYAWPAEPGLSRRAFFVNQAGDVLSAEADYAGPGGGPASDAAFTTPGTITGAAAIDRTGNDGNLWKQGG